MRREFLDLIAPLRDDRLGHNHQSSTRIHAHDCEHLDSLAEAHLVAQETARVVWVRLALGKPAKAIVLVRRDEAGLQKARHLVLGWKSSFSLGLAVGRHQFLSMPNAWLTSKLSSKL
jgi:hypothetical protein